MSFALLLHVVYSISLNQTPAQPDESSRESQPIAGSKPPNDKSAPSIIQKLTTSKNRIETDITTVHETQRSGHTSHETSIERSTTSSISQSSTVSTQRPLNDSKRLCAISNQKNHRILQLNFEHDTFNEKEVIEFKCSLKMPNACKAKTDKDMIQKTQLLINDQVQREGTEVSSIVTGDDLKTFQITLNYESHDNTLVKCMVITPGSNFTSNVKRIPHVIKYHHLELRYITASKNEFTAGQTVSLICTAEDEHALELLGWYISVDDSQKRTHLNCRQNITCQERKTQNPYSSVITFQTSKDVSKYEFECSTRKYSLHKAPARPSVEIHLVAVNNTWVTVVSVAVPAVLCVVILLVFLVEVRRRKLQSLVVISSRIAEVNNNRDNPTFTAPMCTNPYEDQRALLNFVDNASDILERIARKHPRWEVEKDSLKIKEQIGAGNFGTVFSGTMPNKQGIIQNVAIKTIKEQSLDVGALLDFEKEIDMMTSIHHDNIVNLLGICTKPPLVCIITELMEHGQLNTYLADFAPTKEHPLGGLSVSILTRMCQQPLDALQYLSSKDLIHRDVSARNCLVGANNIVRLADFGLSRDTSDNAKNYYKKAGGMVPVKWMAPEALTYGKYTSSNDVWAFGVLCWEVYSFGAQPYAHLNNQEVMVRICKGERLERPQVCPESLWDVIIKCWSDAPGDRITFPALLTFFMENFKESDEQ